MKINPTTIMALLFSFSLGVGLEIGANKAYAQDCWEPTTCHTEPCHFDLSDDTWWQIQKKEDAVAPCSTGLRQESSFFKCGNKYGGETQEACEEEEVNFGMIGYPQDLNIAC